MRSRIAESDKHEGVRASLGWHQTSFEDAPEGFAYVRLKLKFFGIEEERLRKSYASVALMTEALAADHGIPSARAEVTDIFTLRRDATSGDCVHPSEEQTVKLDGIEVQDEDSDEASDVEEDDDATDDTMFMTGSADIDDEEESASDFATGAWIEEDDEENVEASFFNDNGNEVDIDDAFLEVVSERPCPTIVLLRVIVRSEQKDHLIREFDDHASSSDWKEHALSEDGLPESLFSGAYSLS
eukprot:g1656.t1